MQSMQNLLLELKSSLPKKVLFLEIIHEVNTNNIVVKVKNDGSKDFVKKDEVRRKTDGFSAFVCALWQADQILVDDVDFLVGDIEY
ncbi:hypothetical protein SAMN05444672_16314 [Bacillus sp. OK838]|nr:hypothetical protein SAMN05444672_16314 [Bacillus sp. OK838]